jgi:cell division protein FtsN
LSVGLAVALVVYLRNSAPVERAAPAAVARDEPVRNANAPSSEPAGDSDENRFDFYEILPEYEVVIPEVESPERRNAPSRALTEPGRYILQAGSFTSAGDADRLQANLALLGIESRIQRVTIDEHVFHRVRIGPVGDLERVDRIRRQLRGARIEPLVMKVQD